MRVALLPTIGQPHILGTWLKYYERWQNEVDKLLIHVGAPSHGKGIAKLLSWVKPEDMVMLIEEDAIIFKKGIVDQCFSFIEKGKCHALGSPRMSCHSEIADAAKKKYRLDYSGLGDKGPNYWPNFFFCQAKDLLQTDRHFEAKSWKKGDYIKPLNHLVKEEAISGDTFVWTSLQLRAMWLSIKEIPQYHSSPYDLDDYQKKEGLWDGKCSWFHLGSLAGVFSQPQSKMEKLELERRVMWHEFCGHDMHRVIKEYSLNDERIKKWQEAYKELLK